MTDDDFIPTNPTYNDYDYNAYTKARIRGRLAVLMTRSPSHSIGREVRWEIFTFGAAGGSVSATVIRTEHALPAASLAITVSLAPAFCAEIPTLKFP